MAETEIDVTQWLPRGAAVVNSFRMAQGDLDGHVVTDDRGARITHARTKDITILRNLIERGFLEEFHVWYGTTYMELRNSLYGQLMAKSTMSFLSELAGDPKAGISNSNAHRMACEVMREVGLDTGKVIERAYSQPYAGDAAAKFMPGINSYRMAFEKLVSCTDAAIRKVKDEIEKELAQVK